MLTAFNVLDMKLQFRHSLLLYLQDDIMSLETEKQTFYLQLYRPVYFQLVDILLHKARFPNEHDYATWSSDDKEQFRTYR